VSYRWRYLCEIADRYRPVSSQAVRFNEYAFLFEPGQQVILHTVKLDVADAAVGEQMTADAHMHLALLLIAGDVHFTVLFERGFSCWQGFRRKYNLVVVVGGLENQRWFVFQHDLEESVHSGYRVEFYGRRRIGKKCAKREIEFLRFQIFCYLGGLCVRGGSVRYLISAGRVGGRGGRHGGEGGSDIDPRRLHVEKPTRVLMTFYLP